MTYSTNEHLKSCLAISLVMPLLGCGMSGESFANPVDSDQQHATIDSAEVSHPQPVPVMNKEKQVELAKQHLAAELEIVADSIELTGIQSVTWRSGAMGCPKPGMMYTQALVPGVLIKLTVDGKAYHYHASRKGQPFYCPGDRAETPSPTGGDI